MSAEKEEVLREVILQLFPQADEEQLDSLVETFGAYIEAVTQHENDAS